MVRSSCLAYKFAYRKNDLYLAVDSVPILALGTRNIQFTSDFVFIFLLSASSSYLVCSKETKSTLIARFSATFTNSEIIAWLSFRQSLLLNSGSSMGTDVSLTSQDRDMSDMRRVG